MSTRLTFFGAARIVTGSCFAVDAGGRRILVDCGMFQGPKTEKELNYRPFPFDPATLDAVILSHAHIDHSGLLPKLAKAGYRGPIYATPPSVDLAGVMLPDSGHIQEVEVEQLNRRNARRGREPVTPIYTAADAAATLELFRGVRYEAWFEPAPGIRARFWNAGHLLGSASIEMEVQGVDGPQRLLFSADLGPDNKLLHPDPEAPTGFDYVVCESTYGATDRLDASAPRRRAILRQEIRQAINPNGALLIPSFAVERTQELIADISELIATGELPEIPIYIDSPLATRASQVFARHVADLEDGALLVRGLQAKNVRFTETVEQSKALDRVRGFHIVIAASGMCEAGRIRHRLKNWLWRDEATVLMVGYQAEGTLGRILLDGAGVVRIQGEEVKVRARIRAIDVYSGHADGPELAEWVRERLPIRHQVFLVHGEMPGLEGLKARLAAFLQPGQVVIPALDESYELTAAGARLLPAAAPPRIERMDLGRPDWHNDVSRLFLDISTALDSVADEKARGVLIRKLRRALAEP